LKGHDFSRAEKLNKMRGLQPLKAISSHRASDRWPFSAASFSLLNFVAFEMH
jgi:hypothetical protein